jgi:hypothetical protein
MKMHKDDIKVSWNKGKQASESHRLNISNSLKGRIPWNKGLKKIKEIDNATIID